VFSKICKEISEIHEENQYRKVSEMVGVAHPDRR